MSTSHFSKKRNLKILYIFRKILSSMPFNIWDLCNTFHPSDFLTPPQSPSHARSCYPSAAAAIVPLLSRPDADSATRLLRWPATATGAFATRCCLVGPPPRASACMAPPWRAFCRCWTDWRAAGNSIWIPPTFMRVLPEAAVQAASRFVRWGQREADTWCCFACPVVSGSWVYSCTSSSHRIICSRPFWKRKCWSKFW